MARRLAAMFLLQCSIAGCNHAGDACTRADQCASGFCKPDGTCGPASADARGSDAPSDGSTVTCTPNHDGTITLGELPLHAGEMASFRIATNATWSTAGMSNPDGSRAWDLSIMLAGDADHSIALASPVGAWWQPDFATATYATPLSASSDLIGVFVVDGSGVALLGVVSPQGGAQKTELTYDPPARILSTPFQNGSTWSTTSSVTGYAQGALVAYSEQYRSMVDQVGTMKTPYGTFPVLRVATDLTRTSGVTTLLSNRTFAWAAECFGIVATVQSQSFESGAEFSDDAEVRRLVP